ncbi:MarR family transcriptional regulator [Geminicoccaceae bacterium 1502E]|nr:MarR family transcriptional regulator [Geminicoccaceae bacterium 1502E]
MTNDAKSPRARFGMELVVVARQWRRALDRQLAAVGLTDATWAPLVHLKEAGGGISQKELAALAGIDGSSLVRLLDVLEGRGLVERRIDEADRRARRLHLTARGEEAVRKIRRLLKSAEQTLLADLGDEEVAALTDGLAILRQRLERA